MISPTLIQDAGDTVEFLMDSIMPSDHTRVVYIRHEPRSLTEAINQQLTHASYHVGQMVFLAKMILDRHWRYLSTPPSGPVAVSKNKEG